VHDLSRRIHYLGFGVVAYFAGIGFNLMGYTWSEFVGATMIPIAFYFYGIFIGKGGFKDV
jgi:hypothetical protein